MTKKSNWWWVVILIIAVFWRLGNFGNRWVFNQDQARDATMGLFAWRNGMWPEIGSPSSAGPFNFGPWYHWIIMLWEKIIPMINGPWIGFGMMSIVSVMTIMQIGKILYGQKGMIIFGLMAAFATGQVQNAPDMLNTVIVGVSGIGAMWTGLKLIKTEKIRWMVITGFLVGLSINFHFQAMGTLSWLVALVLVNKFEILKRIRWAVGLGSGLILAFLPLIIFDIKRNGMWIRSVVEYYMVGVNKFYVPVRWLTEIRDFWPQLFGAVTTGQNYFGYIWVILGIVVFIKNRKKIDRYWWVMFASLLIQVWLMRSYKGVRSREYMIGFHGFIILICCWITVEYYKMNKYFGVFILGVFLIVSGVSDWKEVFVNRSQANDILEIKKILDEKYKGLISLENYQESDMIAMPLFYLYYYENRIGKGTQLSVCDGNRYVCPSGEIINKNKYRIYGDKNLGWYQLTAENIYKRLWVNYGD